MVLRKGWFLPALVPAVSEQRALPEAEQPVSGLKEDGRQAYLPHTGHTEGIATIPIKEALRGESTPRPPELLTVGHDGEALPVPFAAAGVVLWASVNAVDKTR